MGSGFFTNGNVHLITNVHVISRVARLDAKTLAFPILKFLSALILKIVVV